MTGIPLKMKKYPVLFLIVLLTAVPAFSQKIKIQISGPGEIKGRKAVLLTREKGFAAMVHSVKLTTGTVELEIGADQVPDLYQLHVSQTHGSLFFFLEPDTKIQLDTTDLSKSVVTHSKSNPAWEAYQNEIQRPYDNLYNAFTAGETRARKQNQTDSLAYWLDRKITEHRNLLKKTGDFILNNPASYVSLYLLKNNWYAFKDKGLFEKLDVSLASHRSYKFLKERGRGVARN
ncbi:hypothetical protein DYBT9275_00092 [Dyadobacter sp. CECT 9275]|uniref:DUF4369 domain-containing protein n=2 Tax=Dyadobacter helix TaxID=2822344 RepID=A0A916N3W4_9BACT|nr:hypothetical protein DYBT9275_00092 [Dyadobacter sp. CECT 9275]